MEQDYKQSVRERILDSENFVRAVFSGRQKGASLQWNKVTVRPIEIKGKRNLQFSHFDDKQDISKNYPFAKAASKVDKLLALPFRNILVESSAGGIQVNISKKGKAIISKLKPSAVTETTLLTHDRQKNKLLSVENAAPFLRAVNIMTGDGKIRADMQRKFKQINEFLRLVDETDSFRLGSTQAFSTLADSPIHIVDFGCGNAYLTFAIYFYLHDILKLDAHVTGIDVKTDLIEKHKQKAESLGWDQLTFQVGEIADYEPETIPNVVLALHACDTATDDAIAKGIGWDSKVIICAPCCQHELQSQLSKIPVPSQMLPVYQDGILSERMGDILTDTFRATILRIMGYRTDVTQFVPIEHTAKNLMIRSVKTNSQSNERWVEEYRNLKSFWKVTPYLERLLDEEFAQYI